ncbi:hypothetical protein A5747_13420 [Mycobacterium sp. IS-836]|uniref:hypothetical protein n=1 Tax=Mycobacterium sp. IS-836 TaxID=1834160 RepID=UPI00096F7E2C|nr:hypothetical protein [Mycobacterium sp. IS-836]OMC55387.1 hypothetical protein A5747_13420 [Mycobacterium sp. IS-836]
MDPNATLEMIREQLKAFYAERDAEFDAIALADMVAALDDWLSRGGFLPDAWKGQTYSRPDIVNGTGWTRGARFRQV